MEKYLTEANWKATGQKHLPPLGKTKIPDALKEYAKAEKLPLTVAGSAARKKAFQSIYAAIEDAEKRYPKAKHPKLDAELKKVEAAAKKEQSDYNGAIREMNVDYARKDSQLGKILRERAIKEFGLENVLFLEAVSARKSADELYDQFIDPKSKTEVNLPSSVTKVLIAKKQAGTLSLGDFGPAVAGCEDNLTDTLERLKDSLFV